MTYMASDAYPSWKVRVQAATESIRVFTPYLDGMLRRLLSNSELNVSALSIVTDLSPASGALDYRGQLLGVRALLGLGIEVRSLHRLHAKVLVCDGRVTIGSQNFTNYARRSRETTAFLDDDFAGLEFSQVLNDWFEAALPIRIEFIEQALAELDAKMKAAETSQSDLIDAADIKKKAAELQRRQAVPLPRISASLGRAVQHSHQRLAREQIWAQMKEVGEWNRYGSLVADRESDLTNWTTRTPDGTVGIATIERLKFYPLILNPSGRMGFARVGRTRITYVRDSVSLTKPHHIGDHLYAVQVHFPSENLETANLHITFRPQGSSTSAGIMLRIRIDGAKSVLSEVVIVKDNHLSQNDAAELLSRHHPSLVDEFTQPATFQALVHRALNPFTFKDLDTGSHDADGFFPPGWLQVTLIDFEKRHVLVVSVS